MVDENGKIMTGEHVKPCNLTVDSSRDRNAFCLLKFALDYEDFFDGTTVLITPEPGSEDRFCAIHRCGATVFRSVRNMQLISESAIVPGFYSFRGDGSACVFPSEWRSKIRLSLRAKTEFADNIVKTQPDYCSSDEWKAVFKFRPLLDGSVDFEQKFVPVNQLEHNGERMYYGDIILSRFVKEMYRMANKDAFFRTSTLKQFVDLDANFAIVGDREDMILLTRKDETNGETENTLICSMDEEAGVFDYKKYDDTK